MASPEPDVRTSGPAPGRRPSSVLVTGMPRSGTTWLARELARTDGAGLAGREPMNPRRGQFALGGTLAGWVELDDPTPRQVRLLRRCYAGREPRVLSRYGERQLRAAMPGGTTVVKDPFALLSLPSVVGVTGAVAVVVYRPAAALLGSYRRMGWRADTAEIRALPGGPAGPGPADDVDAMAEFYNELHRRLLERLDAVPGAVVVSHPELASGGERALEALTRRCGLGSRQPPTDGGAARQREPGRRWSRRNRGSRPQLHDFARSTQDVTDGWRDRVAESERERLERATADVWRGLQRVRADLGA